ncbi:MAG: hypothetical protein WD182_00775 [Bacteroidota bacterium]
MRKVPVAKLLSIERDQTGEVNVIYQGASGHIYKYPAIQFLDILCLQEMAVHGQDPNHPYPAMDLMVHVAIITGFGDEEKVEPEICKEAIEMFLSGFIRQLRMEMAAFYRGNELFQDERSVWDLQAYFERREKEIQDEILLWSTERDEVQSCKADDYNPPSEDSLKGLEELGLMGRDDEPLTDRTWEEEVAFRHKAHKQNIANLTAEVERLNCKLAAFMKTRESYERLDLGYESIPNPDSDISGNEIKMAGWSQLPLTDNSVKSSGGAPKEAKMPDGMQRGDDDLGPNIFRREGDVWIIRFGGKDRKHATHVQGHTYIHHLLSNPGKRVLKAELEQIDPRALATFDAQDLPWDDEGEGPSIGLLERGVLLSDPKALTEYKRTLQDLSDDIKAAKDINDIGTVEKLRLDYERIEEQLRISTGRNGKPRELSSEYDKMRKRVSAAINRAITRISHVYKDVDRGLYQHLDKSIRRGSNPAYLPLSAIPWDL